MLIKVNVKIIQHSRTSLYSIDDRTLAVFLSEQIVYPWFSSMYSHIRYTFFLSGIHNDPILKLFIY